MHFKLIIAFVEEEITDLLMETARQNGATGSTVISNARGEGLKQNTTFFGLALESQRDMLLLLVEEHLCRHILETLCLVGEFDSNPGRGIAFQIDVEDAVGINQQIKQLTNIVEEEL